MTHPSHERPREYRAIAEELRRAASTAKQPGVKAELTCLAHSYDRLADKATDSDPVWTAERSPARHPVPAKSR